MDPELRCPKCGAVNAADAEVCVRCREPLTPISAVLSRHERGGSARWLEQVRLTAGELKEKSAQASEERLSEFRELDRRREQGWAEADARQKAKDRRMILIVFAALLLFLGFLCGAGILALLQA